MSKKILSVVLFAAMLLSMVVANAAEVPADTVLPVADEAKPTGLLFVAVSNPNADDAANVYIAPPGSAMGIMIPGVNATDEIFISGAFETIVNRQFEVAIVLNGLLDTRDNNIDKVWINDAWVDISSSAVCGVTADGLNSIIYTKFNLDWNPYVEDMSSSRTYYVKVVKDGGASFDFEFTVNYIDEAVPSSEYAGINLTDYSTALGAVDLTVDPVYTVPATDYTVGNATVSVNTKLNVRAGAGTSFDVLGQLDNGDYVYVLSVENNWAALADDDGAVVGYVYAKYLVM